MKIAVIGTGNVGGALGRRWSETGHEVTFAARDPDKPRIRELVESTGGKAQASPIPQAVEKAEVVVLAVPWAAAPNAIRVAGDLTGKIVVDCTNPIKEGLAGLSTGGSASAGEQVASWARGAKVVKAFNTTGSGNLENPRYGSQRITMFLCGDDPQAKKVVSELAEDLDFEVVDTGSLHTSRYLEPLAMLWINLAYARGMGPDIAFKVLKR